MADDGGKKKISRNEQKSLVYLAARERGCAPGEAFELSGSNYKDRARGLYRYEQKYRKQLLVPRNFKLAKNAVLKLAQGKHPGSEDQKVPAKVVLDAANVIINRAVPIETKVRHDVSHKHKFTDIPLEGVVNSRIIDVTPGKDGGDDGRKADEQGGE